MKMPLLAAILCLAPAALLGDCPTADLTGDCFVDMADFALLASRWLDPWADLTQMTNQWLAGSRIPADMIHLAGGTFQMGDPLNDGMFADGTFDRPVHPVTLDPFCIGKTEVTNAQFCQFLNSSLAQDLITNRNGTIYPYDPGADYPFCDTSAVNAYSQIIFSKGLFCARFKGGRSMADDPMVCVTWFGAAAYCNWKSQQEGREICYDPSTWICDFTKKGYRLPTEAEWEFAARGGTQGQRFPWGADLSQVLANYRSSNRFPYDKSPTFGYHPIWNDFIEPLTAPVGQFPPNTYGLYDMIGNVWEWCHDRSGVYLSDLQINPTGPTSGTDRILRGGCWNSLTIHCRTAYRFNLPPDYRSYGGILGFRLCRDAE
jgi:formylglycine-generating enzyme